MVQIRRAVHRDAEALARLCGESAAEERAVSLLDVERIRSNGFGGNALFEAWIAESKATRAPVGCAVMTKSYDIRRGVPTVVLCELYVAPQHRRIGLARRLMSAVAQRAMDLGARDLIITTGVENAVAQRFFAAIGARAEQAAVFHMSGDGIQWLATEGQ